MKLHFKIPYFTRFGQRIGVCGDILELGNNDIRMAFPLQFQGNGNWVGEIDCSKLSSGQIVHYNYILFDDNTGRSEQEWGDARTLTIPCPMPMRCCCIDHWNASGGIENVFLSAPFSRVFFRNLTDKKQEFDHSHVAFSHHFIVKAPLISESQIVCLIGNCHELKEWNTVNPLLMKKNEENWEIKLDLKQVEFDIYFKFGIWDLEINRFICFEDGADRLAPALGKDAFVKLDCGFYRTDYQSWRGAGVGVPVFSLRSRRSFGSGDFVDLKLMIEWAAKVGLKMIQLLPLNDTNGTHTDIDVLPYAAISAFALNPLFLNLPAMGKLADTNQMKIQYIPKQAELNARQLLPFLEVVNFKVEYAYQLYLQEKEDFLKNESFISFFEQSEYWLKPYSAYCVLRDKFGTNDHRKWNEYSQITQSQLDQFVAPDQSHFDRIGLHYFIQYHLHLQLADAAEYAHRHGVVLKGDIPIGVNRNSVDAWVNPDLFHMGMNAGAPPDMFAVKGQNWGLPTYNWKMMNQNGFKWWKNRLTQMANYFDAFRIDHILGFFRIWQIPVNQIEGIMGYLNPSVPIHVNEFGEKGIWFDYNRFCKPFITDQIIWDFFGEESVWVKANCLQIEDGWMLRLKPEFLSQVYVQELFDNAEISEKIKNGLFDLISNVLFFEVENSDGNLYYPRYGMRNIRSFQELDDHTKKGLDELYVDYFYRRQDAGWYWSGKDKLPALRRSTNMLICGEDLGMMTHCVTELMRELDILSLEVQRAPKHAEADFVNPAEAPYLSVITPSTHDMSTIRGWWEENRDLSQRFYNSIIKHGGEAPYFCEWWICRDIILQHLNSPAMWAVFQIQDLLALSPKLRCKDPNDERINVPSNSISSWRYRMHIYLEDLIEEDEYNSELRQYICHSGR